MVDASPAASDWLLDIANLSSVTLAPAAASSPYSLTQKIIIAIVATVFSIMTVVGNSMVMISVRIDKQLQTISNYFLFSLAVADFAIGLISMPLFAMFTIFGYWPLGPHVCDTWLALDYLASNASVLNLLIISFDRYFSVTRPLTYRVRRTTRRATVMIGGAWGFSLLLWPPWIYAWPYIDGERKVPPNECYIQFIETNQFITFGTAIAAFYVPVTVMCCLYYRIWIETKKRQKDLPNLQGGKKHDSSKRSNSSDEATREREGRARSESGGDTDSVYHVHQVLCLTCCHCYTWLHVTLSPLVANVRRCCSDEATRELEGCARSESGGDTDSVYHVHQVLCLTCCHCYTWLHVSWSPLVANVRRCCSDEATRELEGRARSESGGDTDSVYHVHQVLCLTCCHCYTWLHVTLSPLVANVRRCCSDEATRELEGGARSESGGDTDSVYHVHQVLCFTCCHCYTWLHVTLSPLVANVRRCCSDEATRELEGRARSESGGDTDSVYHVHQVLCLTCCHCYTWLHVTLSPLVANVRRCCSDEATRELEGRARSESGGDTDSVYHVRGALRPPERRWQDHSEARDGRGWRGGWSGVRAWCVAWAHSGRDDAEDTELDEEQSDPGLATPVSVETPLQSSVSRCTSLNVIRDPYAARGGSGGSGGSGADGTSPLRRYDSPQPAPPPYSSAPPPYSAARDSRSLPANARLATPAPKSASADSVYTILIRLPGGEPDADRPSITMIAEESPPNARPQYRLPSRGDSEYNLHPAGHAALARRTSHIPDVRIPLNAKIIPKQLAGKSGLGSQPKPKKKSQEKKQDTKAAKTLSAILLSFIITWTPYNILVLLKPLTACANCIPDELWSFFYALCYINSTINPMCYALCNATFRRTYVRILTCKWHNRNREAMVRGVYN